MKNTNNDYTLIKDIFIENGESGDFVNLDKSRLAYHRIVSALQKPLKLILFYGKPGSGKTFLLNKIKLDLDKKLKVVFLPQPFFDEEEFFMEVYRQIFATMPKTKLADYATFIRIYKQMLELDSNSSLNVDKVVILLDEAQLYPVNLIEKIRLMADTRLFKFLFTVHKTDEEDVLAKDYFKTRIWESIELPNSNLNELKLYIEKKLLFHKFHNYFMMYDDKNFDLIYELTDGNLRNLNKLLYKLYELFEYYELYQPTNINPVGINHKYIEMAAISAGLINA
ncbi:MAG: ATP-binding protein [Campylobacter sp.]|nr:ATP-binding protein [Campylobacter sp.]